MRRCVYKEGPATECKKIRWILELDWTMEKEVGELFNRNE
jgi:hypothetical protein